MSVFNVVALCYKIYIMSTLWSSSASHRNGKSKRRGQMIFLFFYKPPPQGKLHEGGERIDAAGAAAAGPRQ